MDSRIWADIITATATLTAAVVPIVINNLRFASIAEERNRQIRGHWRGITKQAKGPSGDPIEVDLVTEISVSWRTVLLRLSDDGTRLSGRTIGHGMMSGQVVHGEVEFVRIAS